MIPTFDLAGSFSTLQGAGGGGGGPAPGGDATTWNPSDKTTNVTLSNADLTAAANTANYELVRTVRADLNTDNGGKFYWELTLDTLAVATDLLVGMKAVADSISSGSSWLAGTFALWRGGGSYHVAGGWSTGTGAASFAAGDVLMFALDLDNDKMWCGKNGTWNNSGDPAAGTNHSFTDIPSSTDFAFLMTTDNTAGAVQVTLRTEASDFAYSAPSGFNAGI